MIDNFINGYTPVYLLLAVINDPDETAEHKQAAQAELDRRTQVLVDAFKVIDRAIGNS